MVFLLCRETVEEARGLAAMQMTADPLPVAPGEWQGNGATAATEAALQEAIGNAQELVLGHNPYSIDSRPVSEQRSE